MKNVIVDKNEFPKLIRYIEKIDPDAFVTVIAVNDLRFNPKPIVYKPSKQE
jgi:uncharacterized membrane-anchored protein YitT (DUF2179 family)